MEFTQSVVSVFQNHGVWFLLGMAFFPRLTMLIAGLTSALGGPLFWFGFALLPHIMVAVIASLMYWDKNPIVVLCAWFFAIWGTIAEIRGARIGFEAGMKDFFEQMRNI